MNDKDTVLKRVHQALEREKRINPHRFPIRVGFTKGAVVLEGEAADIAAKKLALEHAAAVAGVRGVVDRLHVVPGERRGDGAIRDSLTGFLLKQPELRDCTIRARSNGALETLRQAPADGSGEIECEVGEGIILLEGSVISLAHKRVAGVLAWWTPGRRDVINSLAVDPAEEDSDDEVVDALRLVLEIDPLVKPDRIAARCQNYVVTLRGYVRTEVESRQAELDAWYLFAVDRVVNRLEVTG